MMYGYPNMMGYWGSDGWFGFGLGWLSMIFWWALIIFGIALLIRWVRMSRGNSGCCGEHRNHEKSALDVLKERYAKGEINRQEFEKMKEEIK